MEIQSELLKLKQINSDQKLVMAVIIDQEVPSMKVGCDLTTQEIANLLGMKYKQVSDILWDLQELNLISTVVESRRRESKVTPFYKKLIKGDKKILKD